MTSCCFTDRASINDVVFWASKLEKFAIEKQFLTLRNFTRTQRQLITIGYMMMPLEVRLVLRYKLEISALILSLLVQIVFQKKA